jgi:hypothetical protein
MDTGNKNLDFMIELSARHCSGYAVEQKWGNLHFDKSGLARLANIAGMITGLFLYGETKSDVEKLAAAHKKPLDRLAVAKKLADSICDKLDYLNTYGGVEEVEVDGGHGVVSVPRFRVVLFDDGTLGGFSLLWHQVVTTEQRLEHAKKMDPGAYEESEDMERWPKAIKKAEEDLRLNKNLELNRLYTPEWVREEREKRKARGESPFGDLLGPSYAFFYYAPAWNGGLILHGMGQETFTVDISDDSGPHWGVHT